jgi:hypothetical protein
MISIIECSVVVVVDIIVIIGDSRCHVAIIGFNIADTNTDVDAVTTTFDFSCHVKLLPFCISLAIIG